MIIELRFDDARSRTWMGRLAKLLDDGHRDIQIAWVRTAAQRPAGLEALFELERCAQAVEAEEETMGAAYADDEYEERQANGQFGVGA